MSASRIRSSKERPASAKAMPTEALASTRWPVTRNGVPKQSRTVASSDLGVGIVAAIAHHREFVAAQAGDEIVLAHGRA